MKGALKGALKFSDIVLGGLLVLLCLVGWRLVLDWQEYQCLSQEVKQWNSFSVQTSAKGVVEAPGTYDLLRVIDQCVEIFKNESLRVPSYNLEGIREEGDTSMLHCALIRLQLRGPWQGIERGLMRLEEIPNQGIHVEEAILDQRGGEVLLKIYYLEPDNLF